MSEQIQKNLNGFQKSEWIQSKPMHIHTHKDTHTTHTPHTTLTGKIC